MTSSIDRFRVSKGDETCRNLEAFVVFLEKEWSGEEEAAILLLLKAFLPSLDAKGLINDSSVDTECVQSLLEGVRTVLREAGGELEASFPSPVHNNRRRGLERELEEFCITEEYAHSKGEGVGGISSHRGGLEPLLEMIYRLRKENQVFSLFCFV